MLVLNKIAKAFRVRNLFHILLKAISKAETFLKLRWEPKMLKVDLNNPLMFRYNYHKRYQEVHLQIY